MEHGTCEWANGVVRLSPKQFISELQLPVHFSKESFGTKARQGFGGLSLRLAYDGVKRDFRAATTEYRSKLECCSRLTIESQHLPIKNGLDCSRNSYLGRRQSIELVDLRQEG
jgi:hypothetical protein